MVIHSENSSTNVGPRSFESKVKDVCDHMSRYVEKGKGFLVILPLLNVNNGAFSVC